MKDNEWDSVEEMQETLNKCEKKYFDIQKQLAESENQCRECKHLNKKIELNIKNKLMAENCELQKQLAEKEQENERLNLEFETQEDWQEKWQKLYDETCNLTQDKISFAVEQLTEIRDYVKECWSLETTEGKVRLDIAKKIRLKIEELTHQHEDKGK